MIWAEMGTTGTTIGVAGRRYLVARDDVAVERDLAGVAIPLPQREAWRRAGLSEGVLLSARDETGRAAAALWLELTHTRALPLHVIARADRVGAARDVEGLLAVLSGCAAMAAERANVLRLEIALFHRDAVIRERIARHLAGLGFRAAPEPRSYRATAALDLDDDEAALFARLHRTARRHIRAVEKNPVVLAPLAPAHADAVEALVRETRARTGGAYTPKPWRDLITFAKEHPTLMRWVGLFHSENGELVAFASAHMHGDHATYADAGSTRRDDLKLPMGYALVWDLIRWSQREGAQWFDFGGITEGSHGDSRDPTGGISDFKRYFQGEVVEVGEEWHLEPHPLRARLAGVVSDMAARARALRAHLA